MDLNPLLQGTPVAVEVAGVSVPINSDHRTGIRVQQVIENPFLEESEKVDQILKLYFAKGDSIYRHVVDHAQEAFTAALKFLNLNEERRPDIPGIDSPHESLLRNWDWDHDASRVLSDFRSTYQIDLADPAITLHWWTFWSYFKHLGDTSATMTAIGLRGLNEEDLKDLPPEEKKRLKKRQADVILPARTEKEAMNLTNFFWS